MRSWKVFTSFTTSALLVACAQSSGVLKLGPDTYSVSVHAAPARGGEVGARKLAILRKRRLIVSRKARNFW